MASSSKQKIAFKKARTVGPLYTGGPVALSQDGRWLVTTLTEEAILTDLNDDTQICRFAGDSSTIHSLCLTPDGRTLCVFSASNALRIYDLPTLATTSPVHPTRVIARVHDAPVHVCRIDPTGTYLAAGGADGTVKILDLARGHATHVLRGHGGVVSALTFSYPPAVGLGERVMRLITASVDTRVRVWDLARGAVLAKAGKAAKPEAVLEGHVSVPRGLDVSPDGRWLVSGGRDGVALLWDLEGGKKGKGKGKEGEGLTPVLVNTITALERVEAVGILAEDQEIAGVTEGASQLRIYTAGEKGAVKVWDAKKGSILCTLGEEQEPVSEDQEEQRQILDAIYVPSTSTILTIHADQNLLFHSLTSGTLSRQLVGFNDEIIDAAFLSPTHDPTAPPTEYFDETLDTHIALATNSSLIRLYSASSLDARLLSGHKDIVLALAASSSGRILGSGAKDRTARIWAPRAGAEPGEWDCAGVCEGHAESVGALAFARQTTGHELKFVVTGSQDRTIKMWDLSVLDLSEGIPTDGEAVKLKSLATLKAHEKDINALDVAPNDALLASGSQDKTAKVYALTFVGGKDGKGARGEMKLLGTCKGHKRGVWSVRFAKAERVLASGGGDRTVRIWSLDDYSCLRVLEGHSNSVLRVEWLGSPSSGAEGPAQIKGNRIASAGADGLVKLWDARGEECLSTLDGHEDKVWALASTRDGGQLVSGGADGVMNLWEDCTEELELEAEEARADAALKEQDFTNYVQLRDYRRAVELALALGQPGRLKGLFSDVFAAAQDEEGEKREKAVMEVLRTLAPADLARLLGYVRDWNTRASTAAVAQRVLHALVRLRPADDIVGAFVPSELDGMDAKAKEGGEGGVRALVEALIPYTERHLARAERLVQESYVLDYVLGEMDGLGGLEVDDFEAFDDVKVKAGALDGGVNGEEWDGFGSSGSEDSDDSGMEVDL
ncbi:WD40 repeat-like protein, partial [Peniophora sp. CONT]